ncbi:BTAD domain-containing putative transcriptional regulator [Kutzneria sp. CA-103260]|uniref:BTAD domain-containing putative transcriptional regulator n=1 Tax=Kutzneria sp. CA-103260 TaxID=2802641 RepID=UPI001BAAD00E|nr:BTAD domain-containing putative transcriptional regulator [Kutzneria sp. CA-103260]QUQ67152.1 Bacterial transcriptional activator domain protein [Kutzneria sp. CA-103260]
MQFHVLGPLEVRTSCGARVELRATKPGALLAVLLLNANAWVGVDQLIDGIWHEQAVPMSALRNLRSYVWQLRQTLGERLESRPGGYRIKVLPGELDTEQAGTLAESARAAVAVGAYESAVEQLSGALALWRGTPLEGLTFDAARSLAARLEELRSELRCLLADAHLALDRATDAIALLRDVTDRDPLREGAWAQLVLALHQAGRPAEALAAFERVRKVLHTELGIDPGPELVAAQRKVLCERDPGKSAKLSLVAGSGPASRRSGIDELLASATSEVLIMTAGVGPGQIDAVRRISQANLRPGVRCRVLCPDSARLSGVLSSLSLAGVDVRTDTEIPMEALVVDRTSTVLPADRSSSGSSSGVAVFRLPGVVTATVGLFERIWPGAVPLSPTALADAGDTAVLTNREHDLLTLLCSGSTDESAAARLDISVRTVRRMVADIMNRLGARSRFQAGVKAADRGWLMDKAG